MARPSEVIFVGTIEEARRIYKTMNAAGLTGPEKYILRRYLDLPVPADLKQYALMEDRQYQRMYAGLLDKIPAEAKPNGSPSRKSRRRAFPYGGCSENSRRSRRARYAILNL